MSVLLRLRQETSEQHRSLEQQLDLLRPDLGMASYTDLLSRFHRVHGSWELVMDRLISPLFPGWPPIRRRKELIATDLAALGCAPPADKAVALTALEDGAAALGAMYVVEGSTLGGQLLSRHFQRTLGVTPETGGAYFHGYGAATGAMWREFTEGLEDFAAHTGEHQRMVQGARFMFDTMKRELCGVSG